MAENTKIIELDPANYTLNDYDNVRITLPPKEVMTNEDIDAELFQYVISSGKQIKSIADLDDEWVKRTFEGMETIDEVRNAIVEDYERQQEFARADLKYHACCEVLIDRLEGEIPADVIQNNVNAIRKGNEEQLAMMQMSLTQYLREEHLTLDQYEAKLQKEAEYQTKLNLALDCMAVVLCTQVGNHELTEYLSTPDPAAFIAEIREKGLVEEARRAAVRVKVMRRVVDTAIVTIEGEEPEPVKPVVVEDEEPFIMPDFDEMPNPNIVNADGFDKFAFNVVSTNE
ncbi:MAG: hypothetical protein Q4D06_03150 [Coriobacteriia bacterium]|nr:hypothetical protein [Coriobacteriia bacterium]